MMWTHERIRPKNWKGSRVQYKQYKYNGHRFTVYKQPDRRLVGFEREIRDDLEMTVKRPKIVEYDWWKKLETIPPMSSVDGELYVPFGNAGDAAHAIAECLPTLEFVPFAVPWWKNYNIAKWPLEEIQIYLNTTGLKLAPFFPLAEHDNERQLLDDAVLLGIEGWVLKQSNYAGWWKVKPVKEIDAIVTGFNDGEGKYLGAVGSLLVSIYVDCGHSNINSLVEIAKVSGMKDAIRWDIDEDKDLGRVCEVEYQELGNGKRLIHPRFVKWRDDKPAKQCTYEWKDL